MSPLRILANLQGLSQANRVFSGREWVGTQITESRSNARPSFSNEQRTTRPTNVPFRPTEDPLERIFFGSTMGPHDSETTRISIADMGPSQIDIGPSKIGKGPFPSDETAFSTIECPLNTF